MLDAYEPYCSRCWVDASLFDPVCEADDPSEPRVVRGGDWASDEDALLVGLRNEGLRPDEHSSRVGFRCVRSGASEAP
jgi:formylglycine-generating enzyme required for sulfatase activity